MKIFYKLILIGIILIGFINIAEGTFLGQTARIILNGALILVTMLLLLAASPGTSKPRANETDKKTTPAE